MGGGFRSTPNNNTPVRKDVDYSDDLNSESIRRKLNTFSEFSSLAQEYAYGGDIKKLVLAFGGCLSCAKEQFQNGGVVNVDEILANDQGYQKNVNTIGAVGGTLAGASGMLNAVMPGLGTAVGGLINMGTGVAQGYQKDKVVNNFVNQSQQATDTIFAYGGKLGIPDEDVRRYLGGSHAQGGINITDRGTPTKAETDKEVEGGETMVSLKDKVKLIFSKRLKV